jgi:hypothetical protein
MGGAASSCFPFSQHLRVVPGEARAFLFFFAFIFVSSCITFDLILCLPGFFLPLATFGLCLVFGIWSLVFALSLVLALVSLVFSIESWVLGVCFFTRRAFVRAVFPPHFFDDIGYFLSRCWQQFSSMIKRVFPCLCPLVLLHFLIPCLCLFRRRPILAADPRNQSASG